MRRRRETVAALLAVAALGVAAGCGGGGSGSGGAPSGVEPGGSAGGGSSDQPLVEDLGLSIADVKDLTLEGELDVSGWVVEEGGKTYLCTTAVGSPPACGKPSLVLVGYEGDVPSSEALTLLGEVSGNTITVSG
ncbi:MAG: hypothetical protein OEW31_06280 [Thermoleophilia bacterium]|nr:hypothetical protein [Thermoleophilia bacterium]